MVSRLLLVLVCMILSFSAQAQLYKWVAPDGTVTYSDTPPPKTITNVETKTFNTNDAGPVLPFELAKAVKNMPVTLFTTPECAPCNDGRAFLKQNGIPFSEKTVSSNEDGNKLKQVSGDTQLPFFMIGRSIKLKGYNPSEWRANLSQAGYPETNKLPADYAFSLPQPAAPIAKPASNPANSQDQLAPQDKPARDPNGFQF